MAQALGSLYLLTISYLSPSTQKSAEMVYRELFLLSSQSRKGAHHAILKNLNDLYLNARNLFSHREVYNPFEKEIEDNQRFTEDQKLILCQTIHMLTLLNQLHRKEDHWARFHATREDYLNGLNLMQALLEIENRSLLLSRAERLFYGEILSLYGDTPFRLRELREKTRRSKSNTWWKIRELISKGLVERVGGNQARGYLYQIITK